ncbi:MAG: diguanylate cyclase [Chloroflexi bacterium]|nr:MAG: diguanylate cyclase [Chloroflexota bacterium]
MEVRLYLQMLRRGWWIVLLTMLAAVNLALVAAYLATPMYEASARFIVSPNSDLVTGRDVVTSLEALDKRSIISTYAEFLNSTRIYNETLLALRLDPLEMEDDYTVTTVVLPDANILELSVSGTDPNTVALLANEIGQRAISNISLLYQAYNITMLDPAIAPVEPYSPQPLRDLSLALALGLVGGAALAILSEQIRIPIEAYRQRLRVDSETGVYNSRHFQQMVEDELLQNPTTVTSVGLVDLTGLQDYVETLPPVATQKLLTNITEILRRELRGNDVIGRWTATSFIVMLPSTPGSAAARTFERIRSAVSQPMELAQYGETINLKPYTGVATYDGNMTPLELIGQVKSALENTHRGNTGPLESARIRQ